MHRDYLPSPPDKLLETQKEDCRHWARRQQDVVPMRPRLSPTIERKHRFSCSFFRTSLEVSAHYVTKAMYELRGSGARCPYVLGGGGLWRGYGSLSQELTGIEKARTNECPGLGNPKEVLPWLITFAWNLAPSCHRLTGPPYRVQRLDCHWSR